MKLSNTPIEFAIFNQKFEEGIRSDAFKSFEKIGMNIYDFMERLEEYYVLTDEEQVEILYSLLHNAMLQYNESYGSSYSFSRESKYVNLNRELTGDSSKK